MQDRLRDRFRKTAWGVLLCIILFHAADAYQISAWRKRHQAVGMTVALNPLNPNTVYAEGTAGGVIDVSFDRGRSWTQHMYPGVSSIRQILVHPKDSLTIFCASGSDVPGMVKTTDYGVTWRTVLPGYHIDGESMACDPQHPDTIYAGQFAAGEVYRSTDRGETWTYQGTASDLLCAFNVRPDSSNILYAGTGGGSISKSTNYGFTWHVVKPALGASEAPKICVSLQHPLLAYASMYGGVDSALGIWKTTDGGETWLKTGAPSISLWSLVLDPLNDSTLYAGSFSGAVGTVYKTTDGGVSWSALPSGLPLLGSVWSLKLHPAEPDELWAAVTIGSFGANGVYSFGSTSTGITGHVLDAATLDTIHNGYVTVPSTGDSVDLSATEGAYQFGYFDGDSTATPDAFALAYPYVVKNAQLAFTPDTIVTQNILMNELSRRSIDGTVTDSAAHLPRSAKVFVYQSTSVGSTVYAESTDANGYFHFDSLYISQPPVVIYDRIVLQPEIPFAYTTIRPVYVDTGGLTLDIRLPRADVFVIAAADSGAYLSYYESALESTAISFNAWNAAAQGIAPLGRTAEFNKKTVIFYTGDKHTPLAPAEADSLVACLDAGSNLFLTGQDIVEMNDSTSLLRDYLSLGFGGNSTFSFVTGFPGGLFDLVDFSTVTTAGANNQTSRDILMPLDSSAVPQMGYGSGIRGTAGVRIDSVGGGGKAVVFGFGFEAIATTDSRGLVMHRILEYFDSTLVLGIGEGESNRAPADFRLGQNYPNPFNPVTTIPFEVPVRAVVTLKIYDMLGQNVMTLLDGRSVDRGAHTATFDAHRLASGVYFYRIEAVPVAANGNSGVSGFRSVRRMVLAK